MAGIDIEKTSREMIRNGTWTFQEGTFYQALAFPDGTAGIAGFDGEEFIFPDTWGTHQRRTGRDRIEFILGLNTDLDSFYAEIADSKFSFLIDEFRGLNSPAAPSRYQALIEVIAQQQVSFDFAQKTIRNLVELAGTPLGDLHAFPSPKRIASLEEELKAAKLGYRAGYIKSLTELYVAGELNLELWDLSVEEAIKYLTRFRGIGRWTAELFLAYGLRKNVYPAGDLGVRRGVAKILGKKVKETKEKDVREILEPYRKWKGLLAFYITCYDRKTEMERKRR